MNERYNGQDGWGYQPLDDTNNEEINDLTFILSVIEELIVDPEPSFIKKAWEGFKEKTCYKINFED